MRRLTASVLAGIVTFGLPLCLPLCRGGDQPDELTASLDGKIATLTNLILHERISRYSQVGHRICKLDTFDTIVNVADGTEQYSQVRKDDKVYSHVSQIEGVWSFGETVTMLRTTRDALHDPVPVSNEMSYRYLAADRRWFVIFDSKTFWLDFDASVRICPGSRDVERIVWTSGPLPHETGIARITWTVEFQSVEIAGRLCSIPKTATYLVTRTGNRSDWNVTEFRPEGLYGSQSAISFEP